MFILSSFSDEIFHDPVEQVELLVPCKVRFIEFRSIHNTNVLDLTDLQNGQVAEFVVEGVAFHIRQGSMPRHA